MYFVCIPTRIEAIFLSVLGSNFFPWNDHAKFFKFLQVTHYFFQIYWILIPYYTATTTDTGI